MSFHPKSITDLRSGVGKRRSGQRSPMTTLARFFGPLDFRLLQQYPPMSGHPYDGLCRVNLLNQFNLICPVQSRRQNFLLCLSGKSSLQAGASNPERGAYRDRHGRGMGCGGRGSVGRARWWQGGSIRPVSDQQRADERRMCGRRSRVVLTPRRRRQVQRRLGRPDRARTKP